MKKFYSLLGALMLSSVSFAQGTMTSENAFLEQMGFRLEKDVNWYEGTLNGTPFYAEDYEYGSGNDCLSYTASSTGIALNAYTINQCTNDNMEWFNLQLTGNGIICTPGVKGLASTKNERWIAISGLRANQIIAIDLSDTTKTQFVANSTACNSKTGWADTMTEPLQVYELTDSIHALQELAEEGSSDTFRYFQVNPDNDTTTGWLYAKFNGKSATNMWHMQIWSDKNDAEVVSAPVFSMKGVYDTARWIAVKPGVSTFGNEVRTYYSTDGSEPLYLKDTDVIDYYEYTYDDETGEVIDSVAVYVKVAEQNLGEWGDFLYDASAGDDAYISIDPSMDDDGDGFVTLKARSITDDGVFSDVYEQTYEVGAIVLNAPTLTLVGLDGVDRKYQIGWDNNTLCSEDYYLTTVIDGGNETLEFAVGDVISATQSIQITVSSEGYEDGTTNMDVLEPNVDYYAKDGEKNIWDFQNLSEEQIEKINQQYVIGGKYVDPEDSTIVLTYTREEYLNGETADGEPIPESVEPVYGAYGWDTADSRNTNRHWRTMLTDTTYVDSSTGIADSAVYVFSYAEDQVDLFHDGLGVEASVGGTYPSCYSAMAIFVDGSGLYCMTKGTFTLPEVKYGEYVVFSSSAGTTCEGAQATWDADTQTTSYGYTKSVNSGAYLYSISVYTTENLPDSIDRVSSSLKPAVSKHVYNLAGQQVDASYRGIVIKNGKKYLAK